MSIHRFTPTTRSAYLKVSDASHYLGICPNTLRKYTDLGLVRAKRLPSGDRIYSREWLDQFIKQLPDAIDAN